jgi:hypothetical protein
MEKMIEVETLQALWLLPAAPHLVERMQGVTIARLCELADLGHCNDLCIFIDKHLHNAGDSGPISPRIQRVSVAQ